MLQVFENIINFLGCYGICYLFCEIAKIVIVHMIIKHPELTDNKVEFITKMMYKDKRKN